VHGNDDPELAELAQALLRTVRTGGETEVHIGGPVIRVRVEDLTTGTRLRAVATGVDPVVARALEVEGWIAIEHRTFRGGAGGRTAGGRTARGRSRAAPAPDVVVDDVSRTWPFIADPDAGIAATDVLDAAYILAGPDAAGPARIRHAPLGSEDAQFVAIGAVIGGAATLAAVVLATVLRVLAGYPLDWRGSLVIPLVLGAITSLLASRLVLFLFARIRALRGHAEPTAIVVGALAPAVAVVGYTAWAIRSGLP
jgi:hypothetical protein